VLGHRGDALALPQAAWAVAAWSPLRVALSNQLRAELERFWPGPIGLFKDLDSPISLAFLARYPSPRDARTLGVKRLEAFLSRQRYSGHKPVSELLAKLRSAPEGCAGETEMTARRAVVLGLVRRSRRWSRRSATIPSSSGPRPDLAATQRMLGAAVTPQGGPQAPAQRA